MTRQNPAPVALAVWLLTVPVTDGSGNPGTFTPDPGQNPYFDTTVATSAGAGSYEEFVTAGAPTQGMTFNGTGGRLSYVLAAFAPAVRSVYYSVGTSGANLMAGPTEVTISGGMATFTLGARESSST